jgi:hypothetical protein
VSAGVPGVSVDVGLAVFVDVGRGVFVDVGRGVFVDVGRGVFVDVGRAVVVAAAVAAGVTATGVPFSVQYHESILGPPLCEYRTVNEKAPAGGMPEFLEPHRQLSAVLRTP